MNSMKIPQCGIIYSMITENNRVKCVFWYEKDSIFALNVACPKMGIQEGYMLARRLWERSNL